MLLYAQTAFSIYQLSIVFIIANTAFKVFDVYRQLEHKLVSVPEKRQQNETMLEQEKKKLSSIDELAPIKANVSDLSAICICVFTYKPFFERIVFIAFLNYVSRTFSA